MPDPDQYRHEYRGYRDVGRTHAGIIRDRLAVLPASPEQELREYVAELARPRLDTPQDLVRLVDCRHTRPDGGRCVCVVAFGDERSWDQVMDARVAR